MKTKKLLMLLLASFLTMGNLAFSQDAGEDLEDLGDLEDFEDFELDEEEFYEDPDVDMGPAVANEGNFDSLGEDDMDSLNDEFPDEDFEYADEVLTFELEKAGLSEGYDPEKDILIAIGSSNVATTDPANDRMIFTKREIAFRKAELRAKASMIEAMGMNAEGAEELTTQMIARVSKNPELLEKIQDLETLKNEVMDQKRALKADLKKLKKEIAKGPGLKDRMVKWASTYMDKEIQKLDSSYTPEDLMDGASREKASIEAEIEELNQKQAELDQEASEEFNANKEEYSSRMKTSASSLLYGATSFKTIESWDGSEYTVSCAMIWSSNLNDTAMASITGDANPAKPLPGKGKGILDIKKELNWAGAIGSKAYVDPQGRRYIVAFGSAAIDKTTSKALAQKKASMYAKQNFFYALMGDVSSTDEMVNSDKAGNVDGQTASVTEEKINSAVKQSFNLQGLMGAGVLGGKLVKHPITQKPVVVVMYGIKPGGAAAMKKISDKVFQARLKQLMHNEYVAARGKEKRKAEQRAVAAGKLQGQKRARSEVNPLTEEAIRENERSSSSSQSSSSSWFKSAGKSASSSSSEERGESQTGRNSSSSADASIF